MSSASTHLGSLIDRDRLAMQSGLLSELEEAGLTLSFTEKLLPACECTHYTTLHHTSLCPPVHGITFQDPLFSRMLWGAWLVQPCCWVS